MSGAADRRLECLKLALVRAGSANDSRNWRDIADEFTGWVEGQGAEASPETKPQEAGKPTGRKSGGSAARQ